MGKSIDPKEDEQVGDIFDLKGPSEMELMSH
jgi:hypothetical protein